MGKSPAFQFYPNDWLSSPRITMMSPAEEGAYIRLLCYDWQMMVYRMMIHNLRHYQDLAKGGSRVVQPNLGNVSINIQPNFTFLSTHDLRMKEKNKMNGDTNRQSEESIVGKSVRIKVL